VRLSWAEDDHGRPVAQQLQRPAAWGSSYSHAGGTPLGGTSTERAAAVMSVRRAARASAARSRADALADVRGL